MKKMRRYIIIIVTLIILLSGCKHSDPISPENPKDSGNIIPAPEPEPEPIDQIALMIDDMSLDEKIGQLLILGIEGREIGELDILSINQHKVGGFILFGRNVTDKDQLLNLINSLKEENSGERVPLFISIDEEGGRVSRLSGIFTNLNRPYGLGTINDPDLSYEYGKVLGRKLKEFGFNMNFAPVLDINSNPKNPVIGDRAYGNSADLVKIHALAVMKGIKDESIIPVGKHFPGHGDTGVDSHLELPMVNKTYEELQAQELIPFKAAIDDGIDMIMVAHILYPQLDDLPASMSKVLMGDILRNKLGFEGVIISDDMTMGAIAENYSIEEASLKFLINGGDIVLVGHGVDNPSLVIDRIKKAVENNELSIDDIDRKVYRILKLKERYSLNSNIIENVNIEEVNEMSSEVNKKMR